MRVNNVDKLNQLVDSTVNSLLETILDFTTKVSVIPINNQEVEYYMPIGDKPIVKIDIFTILTYSKKYGLVKAKAIIKPYISELIHNNYNIDAIGYLTNSLGKIYLYAFKSVSRNELQSHSYTILACNSRHSVIAR